MEVAAQRMARCWAAEAGVEWKGVHHHDRKRSIRDSPSMLRRRSSSRAGCTSDCPLSSPAASMRCLLRRARSRISARPWRSWRSGSRSTARASRGSASSAPSPRCVRRRPPATPRSSFISRAPIRSRTRVDFLNVFHASGPARHAAHLQSAQPDRRWLLRAERHRPQPLRPQGDPAAWRISASSSTSPMPACGPRSRRPRPRRAPSSSLMPMRRMLLATPRNATDEMIRAVAGLGRRHRPSAPHPSSWRANKPATLDMLIDHAAYIADLVGPAHVGSASISPTRTRTTTSISATTSATSRCRPGSGRPASPVTPRRATSLRALRARGFSEAETQGIMGENFLRVFP